MSPKFRTLTLPKAEAVKIYQKAVLKQRLNVPLDVALPNAAEINAWSRATADEAERRAIEIASGPDSVSVDMIYDDPRDIHNFWNRIAGDPEE